ARRSRVGAGDGGCAEDEARGEKRTVANAHWRMKTAKSKPSSRLRVFPDSAPVPITVKFDKRRVIAPSVLAVQAPLVVSASLMAMPVESVKMPFSMCVQLPSVDMINTSPVSRVTPEELESIVNG